MHWRDLACFDPSLSLFLASLPLLPSMSPQPLRLNGPHTTCAHTQTHQQPCWVELSGVESARRCFAFLRSRGCCWVGRDIGEHSVGAGGVDGEEVLTQARGRVRSWPGSGCDRLCVGAFRGGLAGGGACNEHSSTLNGATRALTGGPMR